MKTHELSKALIELAHLLQMGPNVDLKGWQPTNHLGQQKLPLSNDSIAVNLSTLASLSNVNKQQWHELIIEYGFPIEIRARDASRDIIGKLLVYLEKNAEARKKLRTGAMKRKSTVSAPLMQALSALMDE